MSLQAATQWDSLAHCFHDYHMYNGRPCEMVGAKGAAANDIAVLRDRVFTRGVLADVAGHLGVDALAADHHVTVAELEATLAAQGVEVGAGDALLDPHRAPRPDPARGRLGPVRRGRRARARLGRACRGCATTQVAAVACDNWAFEVVPSRHELGLPFHAVGIVYMGAADRRDLRPRRRSPRPAAPTAAGTSASRPRRCRSSGAGRISPINPLRDPVARAAQSRRIQKERRVLAVAEVAPAADRCALGHQRLAGAQSGVALAEADLHEPRRDGDRLDALVRDRRRARLAARAGGRGSIAHADAGIVEQRQRAAGAALPRIESAREPVAGPVRARAGGRRATRRGVRRGRPACRARGPTAPRSACEIALGDTPATRASSVCDSPRASRTDFSAAASRDVAGAIRSDVPPRYAYTVPSIPASGRRP